MKKAKVSAILIGIWLLAVSYWLLARGNRWDGQSRFTVIDVSGPVVVKSWDPATSRGIELTLPDNLEIETVGGRGRLLAASLAAAGSADWAAASVAHYLGIVAVGEVSSLSWLDRLRWWWGSRRVQWRAGEASARGWVETGMTADGVEVQRLAPTWDQQAVQLFASLNIAQEKLGLRLINTTPVAGAAAQAARQVESTGIKVVEVASQDRQLDHCLVVSPPELRKTIGVRLLVNSWDCQWQEGEELTMYLGSD